MIQKLMSRKLWMSVAGISTGICMILGVNASDVSTIAGGIVALVSAVSYIVTEGKIDAERVKTAVESAQDVAEVIRND